MIPKLEPSIARYRFGKKDIYKMDISVAIP